jgi:hypothetical protein
MPHPAITVDIGLSLGLPEYCIGYGLNSTKSTGMPMPETTMNKNHLFAGAEYQIWSPRQVFHMQSESAAQLMNNGSDNQFGLCVL